MSGDVFTMRECLDAVEKLRAANVPDFRGWYYAPVRNWKLYLTIALYSTCSARDAINGIERITYLERRARHRGHECMYPTSVEALLFR